MGLPSRFRVIGFDPNPAGLYSHVYTEVCDGGGWRDLDVTRPEQLPEGLEVHRSATWRV
jgi:hypothetical protein